MSMNRNNTGAVTPTAELNQMNAARGQEELQNLTQQVAAQLRVAVDKNLINVNVLNQPLPKNTLLLLNNLLQRVPKLETVCYLFIHLFIIKSQANHELMQLKSAPITNEQQRNEIARLQNEVDTLQSEISRYQEKINSTAPSSEVSQDDDNNYHVCVY
jgi:hypothetical protein